MYNSRAWIQPQASGKRLRMLVHDLKASGCKVRLCYGAKRVDFDVPEREMRWIVLGGLSRLLHQYDDVVSWTPNFQEQSQQRST